MRKIYISTLKCLNTSSPTDKEGFLGGFFLFLRIETLPSISLAFTKHPFEKKKFLHYWKV